MSSIDKISIALPKEMVSTIRESGLDELRRIWQEAIHDNSPGVSPEAVFNRLEQKYAALAGSAGHNTKSA